MKKFPSSVRRVALLAAAGALIQHGGLAQAAADAPAPDATNRLLPAAAPAASSAAEVRNALQVGIDANAANNGAQGDVAELTRLIQSASLNELRTTYNGGYGASLSLYARDLTYYVALFQDKQFWRVIKLQDEARAEEVYASLARQTGQLADTDIRRMKLQAQTAYIERVIALSEDRANRLQADLDVARNQQAKVAEYQREARDEALRLRGEKEKAQAQLRQVQQQVQYLQQQTEAGLPAAR
ncbi:DUF2968 domain-containing protein [Paraburkholderia solisilvae]|uniref:DUF2968 domain-containing protein n=1 Tax=Paraburkholderia solisilvae TaxID=624376 RepID=A0A6J5EBI2_9BURK|nr:DUF2968 domain-containing protein [Paraburkholderia solisilvae]CAB3763829.1 hypothetical protein LMG29739_04201 [Paraburkholderia solisilvae]